MYLGTNGLTSEAVVMMMMTMMMLMMIQFNSTLIY